MAYYRKLPSGKWQATVRRPDGGRITRTDTLKKPLQVWAAATEAALASGKWKDPRKANLTIGTWFARWMPVQRVEWETRRANEASWRIHLDKTFGDVEIENLRKVDVEAWIAERLEAGIGSSAIRRALNLLKSGLEAAVENELVPRNVARKVSPPDERESLPLWFQPQEVAAIVAEMRRRGWESMAVMTDVMVWSGLRWGEAAALNVDDIDFMRNVISVSHILMQSGKDKDYPKTDSSVGEVPCPPWVTQEIRNLVGDRSTGRIFTTRRGGSNLSGANWRRDWYSVLEVAGVPLHHPHVCRHTCASWLVQSGVPLYEVMRQLRHSSIQTTEKYAHLAPEMHDPVREAWEALAHKWRMRPIESEENIA